MWALDVLKHVQFSFNEFAWYAMIWANKHAWLFYVIVPSILLQTSKLDKLIAYFLFQDTVTGFLLAGVGNVDLRRNTNFLIVDSSKFLSLLLALFAALSGW